MSTTSTPAPPSFATGKPGLTSLRKTARPGEKVVLGAFRIASLLTVLITISILVALAIPSLSFFAEVSVFDFLFGTRWAPQFADASFGVVPLVTATAWTTVIALSVAVPFGLGAAIFLAE